MSLREAQKQLARDRIAQAALGLFLEQGYASTTIDEIATAAGTSRMTFYSYFPTRLDLMKDFLGRVNAILDRFNDPQHASSAPDLVEVVSIGTYESILAWLQNRSELWGEFRPYLDVLDEAAAVDRDIKPLLGSWHQEVIADMVRGMKSAGRFDQESRQIRATLAFTQLNHVSTMWSLRAEAPHRDHALKILADSWLHLLCQAR